MEDLDIKTTEFISSTDPSSNLSYGCMAIHCNKCNGIFPVEDEDFKKIQTGLFLTINKESKLSLACPYCKHILSLMFIDSTEVNKNE